MTHRYCVVGNPVTHSKSPLIHRLFAEHTGADVDYGRVELPIEDFNHQLTKLLASGYNGCNVTVPFKADTVSLCAELSDRARLARAVNTVTRLPDGLLHGDNTDGAGLVTDLTVNLGHTLRGQRILIAGAGGATRGILPPLLGAAPAEIVISNRTHLRAQELASALAKEGQLSAVRYEQLQGRFDLIINATSASIGGEVPPIPSASIDSETICYDLMYSDEPTAFLCWGEAQGAQALHDGLGMLVEQAAEAFFGWEGIRPDNTADVIRRLRVGEA